MYCLGFGVELHINLPLPPSQTNSPFSPLQLYSISIWASRWGRPKQHKHGCIGATWRAKQHLAEMNRVA